MRLGTVVLLAAALAGCSSGTSSGTGPDLVSRSFGAPTATPEATAPGSPDSGSPDYGSPDAGSRPPGLDGPLDEPALRKAVLAYSHAYLSGRVDAAYALMSERCRERSPREEFAGDVAMAEKMYDPEPVRSLVAEVKADRARVTYTYAEFDLNQTGEPWTLEGGEWRNDDCW